MVVFFLFSLCLCGKSDCNDSGGKRDGKFPAVALAELSTAFVSFQRN
jgi:hypothetical protein